MSLLAELGVCPACGSRDTALNPEGLIVCRTCGTVLGPSIAAGHLATKRADYFTLESGTEYYWKDARGMVAPKFRLYESLSRRAKSKLDVEIERAAALLSLPKVCADAAKALAARLGKTHDVEYTAAATLFVACRIARIYADDAFKNYDVKRLARAVLVVQRRADVAMPPPPPKQFIYKLAEGLGVARREVVAKALEALDLLTPIIGRGKIAQSVSLLLAARSYGYKIEPREVAKAAAVSEKALVSALEEVAKSVRATNRRTSRRALS